MSWSRERESQVSDALLEQLEARRIHVIRKGTLSYPDRLREHARFAPEVLYAYGRADLFGQRSVAIAGSRHASPVSLAIAARCAEALARSGINVISGYANGVDMAAHVAALSAGSTTTIVLAEGILNFRLKPAIRDVFDTDKVLILSEFEPRARWQSYQAMQRNSTICALADALIVVEAGGKGGTLAAGRTARKMGVPLFVVQHDELSPDAAGNALLIRDGGIPLPIGTNCADLSSVIQLVTTGVSAAPSRDGGSAHLAASQPDGETKGHRETEQLPLLLGTTPSR
jgi:DNA processing protein